MRARFLTLGLLILSVLNVAGQELMIGADELTYRSEFEKNILTSFLSEKNADGFDLMMAGGSLFFWSSFVVGRRR